MEKLTAEQLQSKHKDLLSKHGALWCTEDGQAFYPTAEGEQFAKEHAASKGIKVIEVKAGKAEKPKEAPKKEIQKPKKPK